MVVRSVKQEKELLGNQDLSIIETPKEEVEEEYHFERINADINVGLSTDVVIKRKQHGYHNATNITKGKTIGRIIRDNLLTFFNILYFIITVLLCVARSWNNLTFLPVILSNLTIGIIQEIKAKKMVDKLSLVSAPRATVIRDGEKLEIPTDEIVIDDIVLFQSGDQIYADSIIIEGFVDVNESMITGESDSISKKAGDMLYSGSYIISGSCHSRVEHVGKDNYIEKLASEARKHQKPKSELLRTLNIIIKIVAVIIIPLGLLTFFQNWTINGENNISLLERYAYSINKTAAVVIGMIPAGLFLLTSIALFVRVVSLGKNKILVQELYCIEMLARVDVLCLDKTGTITDGTMRVIDCVEVKNTTNYTIREIVGSMMNSFEETNPTSDALIKYFDKNKVLNAVEKLPFSSKRKYSAVTFVDNNSGENVGSFYLGAPEFVLQDQYNKVKPQVERLASEGCRVLVLGHNNAPIKGDKPTKTVKPIALIVIQDHIREEANDTIQFFKDNDVEIKVISGDNPLTVSEIAHRAGIDKANKFISLEGLSDEEVRAIALDYTVFGRVSPTQKRVLIQALKENKKTVAMTGDGVNDILALKEADCSIAMASGSEAVRYVSHLVLMDSNFASMPRVVADGRRVINNIQRTSSLFLVKTIFTTLLTIMYLVLGRVTNNNIVYPFEPSQLILIELLILGVPATILALQRNREKVQGKFILNVLRRTLPGALTVVLCHGILYYLQPIFGWTQAEYSTFTIILTTAICFYVLFEVTKPFNWWKTIMYVLMVAVCLIAIIYYGDAVIFGKPILQLVKFNERETFILLLLFLVASYPLMLLIDKFLKKLRIFNN